VLADIKKSLEQMKESFRSDAKSVKNSSKNLEIELSALKNQLLKKELKQFDELESTVKLIEQLSILNEYKLNLFKDFTSYKIQKK
jgi:HPt (histidine-containing phosphotransfer) domain-containing protein